MIDMGKLYSHPLAQSFQDMVQTIENLGASPKLTAALNQLHKLANDVEDEINRLHRNAETDGNLLRRYHAWCSHRGCEPSTSDLFSIKFPERQKVEEHPLDGAMRRTAAIMRGED